jgi:hypothetical protein
MDECMIEFGLFFGLSFSRPTIRESDTKTVEDDMGTRRI